MRTVYNLRLLPNEGLREGLSVISRYSINHPLINPSVLVKYLNIWFRIAELDQSQDKAIFALSFLFTLRLINFFVLEVA